MAASETVISAYLRLYTRSELESALRIALNDRASGVMVTQVNFSEGGGSGQVIQGDPNEIITILELCLQRLDDPNKKNQPMMSRFTFNRRPSET